MASAAAASPAGVVVTTTVGGAAASPAAAPPRADADAPRTPATASSSASPRTRGGAHDAGNPVPRRSPSAGGSQQGARVEASEPTVAAGITSDSMMLRRRAQPQDLTYHAAYRPEVTDPLMCLDERERSSEHGRFKQLPTAGAGRKTARYLRALNDAVAGIEEMEQLRESLRTRAGSPQDADGGEAGDDGGAADSAASVRLAVTGSLLANVVILAMKFVVVLRTGSTVFIASLLDSFLDLFAGATLLVTNRLVAKVNREDYPLGKKTFEPLGTLIFSCCMFTASFQMIQESAKVLGELGSYSIKLSLFDIASMSAVIVAKMLLYVYCNRYADVSASVEALRDDHRNDVLSNIFGILCAYVATVTWLGIDPAGAIAVTLYIMRTWVLTGYEQIMALSGQVAPPDIISKLTYAASHHHKEIRFVDTVRAVALGGEGYQVEIDIVLRPDMPLQQAHDIGESLQLVLEGADFVSRAYVHLDYEFHGHNPVTEHR